MAVDVAQLEAKVEVLTTQVNAMNTSLKKMDENVKDLYTALVGNKNFGQEGVIKRIETLEETHTQWKTKVNWMYGYIFGIASIATIIVEFVKAKFK
jgi:tetrahydromethanopterin S-methyltransferase subunit B